MKLSIKHKWSFLGIAFIVFGACMNLPVPSVSALPPVNYFATDGCPGKEEPLKIERNNWKDTKVCCPQGTSATSTSCLFGKYINPLLSFLSALVGIAVVGSIIFGGITYSSSGGDPQRVTKGKEYIRNALIVLAAYLLMYGFLQFLIPGGKFNV